MNTDSHGVRELGRPGILRHTVAQSGLNITITPLSSLHFNVKFNGFQKTATATSVNI